MRSVLCSVVLCGVAFGAAAQEREVTFGESPQVTVTGFAVGSASYDRAQLANGFTAGKLALSLFKPAGDAYEMTYSITRLPDGFRATAQSLAGHYPVGGYVRFGSVLRR